MAIKSLMQIRQKLTRDWANADLREQRLLDPTAWPLEISLGKVTASEFTQQNVQLKKLIDEWRSITAGNIENQDYSFRSASSAVSLPRTLILYSAEQWMAFIDNQDTEDEYRRLLQLLTDTDKRFHTLLVRQRALMRKTTDQDIILAAKIALSIEPGMAQGKPLRALSLHGSDSKFFERNRQLMSLMLTKRFAEAFAGLSLETFLNADPQNQHWLLIVPLDPSLLPFKQLRLRSSELQTTPLPGSHIIIVENERCWHQLPALANTIAILGTGRDLTWLDAKWLDNKHLAYWGDIDTWGLQLLSDARQHQPELAALLMTQTIFDSHSEQTVVEPETAGETPPANCSPDEQALYRYLLRQKHGRLEQEFIDPKNVRQIMTQWRTNQAI